MEYKTDEKILALLAHLGFLTGVGYLIIPVAIWFWKKDESHFVNLHAKQAMLWQGGNLVFASLISVFTFVVSFFTAGLALIVLIPGLILLGFVLLIPSVLAAIAVFQEKPYNYPVTGAYANRL